MRQPFVQFLKISIFLLILLIISSKALEDENLNVELPQGKLRGKDNEFYYSYESIPYAEPPIGDLRFESPKPYMQQWETIFDATRAPVSCLQWDQWTFKEDKLVGQEDCLTVNIYKPKLAANESGPLPVFINIHGGAFMFGSTLNWQPTDLMRSGRFIVATFNYRLGPLGFLSAEDDTLPGNYGLKDQRLAMQWIKQNIGHFGGDATKILVLGFSSGGAAVHYHLLQPEFKTLAKVAVSLSGTALVPWALTKNARTRAFQTARNLKCARVENSAKLKKCLKEKPAADIVRDVRSFLVYGYNPFTTFGPVIEPASVEAAFFTKSPSEIIKSGNFSQIPWLVSYAAQDGAYNAAELLRKSPRGEELIEDFNERWYDLAPYNLFYKDDFDKVEALDDHSTALKTRYLGEKEFSLATYFDVQRMYTDVLFKNGAQQAVELHKNFNAPLYAYVYDNPADENIAQTLANRTDIKFGTVHGDDFALIMSNAAAKQQPRPDQRLISEKLIKMLADFVSSDNGELTYDTCKFEKNFGRKQLALMFITKDACESKNVENFP